MRFLTTLITHLALLLVLAGCANFRRLGEDLKFKDETVIISAKITNATSHKDIRGVTLQF